MPKSPAPYVAGVMKRFGSKSVEENRSREPTLISAFRPTGRLSEGTSVRST